MWIPSSHDRHSNELHNPTSEIQNPTICNMCVREVLNLSLSIKRHTAQHNTNPTVSAAI